MNLKKRGLNHQNLAGYAGYLFIAQFILFVGFTILLPSNTQFFEPSSTIVTTDFLAELSQNPNIFFILKSILLALRTCYALSFVFVAILFWEKNKIASASLVSFTLISVAIINVAQLMGLALIPSANDYAMAISQGDQIRMVSLEVSAHGIYAVQEYLDTFVNTVTFNGIFLTLFAISYSETGLRYTKWLIPIMMILPYNKFFDPPVFVSLGASLLNVVVTAIYFLLMGRFLLKMRSQETAE